MTDDHARMDIEAKMTKPMVSPTGSGPSTAERAIPMEAALKVILPARWIRDMLFIEADWPRRGLGDCLSSLRNSS